MRLSGTSDLLGYHDAAGGWLAAGWIGVTPDLAHGLPLANMSGQVDDGDPAGIVHLAFCERRGSGDTGTGFLLFVACPGGPGPLPRSLTLRFGQHEFRIGIAAEAQTLSGANLLQHFQRLLATVTTGQAAALAAVLRMAPFAGIDTTHALRDRVRAGVDELVMLPGSGALLFGWLLAAPGVVRSMRFCWGATQTTLAPALLQIDRPDVIDALGHELGFQDARCGFFAELPAVQAGPDAPYLLIETRDRQIAHVPIDPGHLRGLAAIRRVLDMLEIDADAVRTAFDASLGAAIGRLNQERLAEPAAYSVLALGDPPASPRCSLLIPLHGRIDFIEYQMGLMSADAAAPAWDIVYVLDDPPRRRDAAALARSVHARFGIPFRLVSLADNRGYAVANNLALTLARGTFVCFLNSDVVPGTKGFADRLATTLEADPALGAVGPLLLFEDGSVQHEGMALQPRAELGGLRFPIHTRKGRRPRGNVGVERCESITGACLVMRRSLALELGGFDEDYVLGDFEDCDLCTRLQASGQSVAVDHSVRLYHLERQSQAAPDTAWRRNLTLYNAWVFASKHASPPAGTTP